MYPEVVSECSVEWSPSVSCTDLRVRSVYECGEPDLWLAQDWILSLAECAHPEPEACIFCLQEVGSSDCFKLISIIGFEL